MSLLLAQPRLDITSPVNVTATFDPPAVRPGEQSLYRLTFTALEQSIDLPAEIVTQPKLQMEPGARGLILQPAGAIQIPFSAFNFRVSPAAPGEYTVPEFVLNIYGKPVTVPAAKLQVTENAAPTLPPPTIFLEMAATNLFVGQPVRARVRFPGSAGGAVQPLAHVQFNGEGFLVDQGAIHQSIQAVPAGQTVLANYIYETTLTPISLGKTSLFAQGFAGGNRFSGAIIISGNVTIPGSTQPTFLLLESAPVELQVRPLPREGELPGFTGAIGKFSLDRPQLSTNVVRVGDPVRMAVTIRAEAGVPSNLARLVAPPAPLAREWQILPAVPASIPPQLIQAQGFVIFHYTLVPLTETATTTPPIPFSFFDPLAGTHTDLTIPAVPLTVEPGVVPANLTALRDFENASGEKEETLTLSGLSASRGKTALSLIPAQQRAWFPLVQITPALAFFGLLAWARRRRYLDANPHVLLRRRARRRLRKEWRIAQKAARAGDAARFATATVSAMQVACAPHYPATPRALVGSDILELLGNGSSHAEHSDAVRKLFSATDASQFAGNSAAAVDLLTLQPQLERVLQQLKERL